MLFFKQIWNYMIFTCVCLTILMGCTNTNEYMDDVPFVTASMKPGGPDDFRNLIGEQIEIFQDGTLLLSDGEAEGTDKPVVKIQLETNDIKDIKEKIIESKFRKLRNDISSPSEDGTFYTIQANFIDHTKKVSGWNPDNEQFNQLHTLLFSFIPEETYKIWLTEIEEYVWEHEYLQTSEKEDYETNEPFFTFNQEIKLTNEPHMYAYYMQITLDINGALVVYATDKNKNIIPNTRKIEKKIKQTALNDFEEILLENFWKLNENVSNSYGQSLESMTVFLTEEEKTVKGKNPDSPRFVVIKEAILNLLGTTELKQWQKEVEQQMEKM